MSSQNRNGEGRHQRQVGRRPPQTEYYLIVTDTQQTEKNYLEGLKRSLPEKAQRRIQIKFKTADTPDLIDSCLTESQRNPQFRNCWIVLDRDEVSKFDEIIYKAKESRISVAWSNPCLEIWFHAYFGEMPDSATSHECIQSFSNTFSHKTGTRYKKNDSDIYRKLIEWGDEERAIRFAEEKYQWHKQRECTAPSQMKPCTKIHCLVKSLKKFANITQD